MSTTCGKNKIQTGCLKVRTPTLAVYAFSAVQRRSVLKILPLTLPHFILIAKTSSFYNILRTITMSDIHLFYAHTILHRQGVNIQENILQFANISFNIL
jgi:hypothetical protein